MEAPGFLLDWGRVQKLLEERYGQDVDIAVDTTIPPPALPVVAPPPRVTAPPPRVAEPPPSVVAPPLLAPLPRVVAPPPRLSRPPDSIAPAELSAPHLQPAPRRLGWVVGSAVVLSAGILAAAIVRVALRTEPSAAASQAVSVVARTVDPGPLPPSVPQAIPTVAEAPVISVDKLPRVKSARPGKATKAKKH
jgi:hypothetical protein